MPVRSGSLDLAAERGEDKVLEVNDALEVRDDEEEARKDALGLLGNGLEDVHGRVERHQGRDPAVRATLGVAQVGREDNAEEDAPAPVRVLVCFC